MLDIFQQVSSDYLSRWSSALWGRFIPGSGEGVPPLEMSGHLYLLVLWWTSCNGFQVGSFSDDVAFGGTAKYPMTTSTRCDTDDHQFLEQEAIPRDMMPL